MPLANNNNKRSNLLNKLIKNKIALLIDLMEEIKNLNILRFLLNIEVFNEDSW